jgi:predicted GNAT family acetyltransferase
MRGATGLSTDRMMTEGAAIPICRPKAHGCIHIIGMKTRYVMQLDLRLRLAQPAHPARNPRLEEREALAQLMLAAYRGGADDEGETIAEALQEVDHVLVSAKRPFIPEASFVIEIDAGLASASLVSLFRGMPLVTHIMTHPNYKRRGLGAAALLSSAHALRAQGWNSLSLYVTHNNAPALALYRKLGFPTTSTLTVPAASG